MWPVIQTTMAYKPSPQTSDCLLNQLFEDSVRTSLQKDQRKKSGSRQCRLCPKSLLLRSFFTDIFSTWLSQAVVTTCLNATTIIPVQKKTSPWALLCTMLTHNCTPSSRHKDNNLHLNVDKTKEVIVDFRSVVLQWSWVGRGKFLGVHIC